MPVFFFLLWFLNHFFWVIVVYHPPVAFRVVGVGHRPYLLTGEGLS